MITISTDQNNDLFLDKNNNIAVWNDNINVTKQLCQNYLQTFLGEVFTNRTLGVDWFGIMFSDETSLQTKLNELSRVILTVPFVIKVIDMQYTQDKINSTISFVPKILTDYGIITLKDIVVGV